MSHKKEENTMVEKNEKSNNNNKKELKLILSTLVYKRALHVSYVLGIMDISVKK